MLHRFYFSPIIHCPSLCPHNPPRVLFRDDYDPGREEAVWRFCTEHCWLASEYDRPCLVEFERRRALERRKREGPREQTWLEPERIGRPTAHA